MSRENFYLLLELPFSPPEMDINKINAAINKKQAEWSKLRNHPTKGRQAQLYLDMLSEIKTVMADETQRREEAKQAKIIAAQKEKDKYKDLDRAIQLLSAKRKITLDEIKKLSQKFSIPENVIRKRIKVEIVEGKSAKTPVKRLEPAVQKKIAGALKIAGKQSLYDFLELSPTSSINTLNAKAKQKDLELKKDAIKDAKLTASLELVGHCLSVFKTEEMRKMYDATLAYQRLDELNKDIDIAGMDGTIEVEEFDALVKKAKEFGLNLEEAEDHIMEYCKQKKWSVQKPVRFTVEDMTQCGNCGVLNKSAAKNCSGCGFPLVVKCPKCSSSNPSTNTSCSKCGFPIGDMPNALPLIRQAKNAAAKGELKKASDLFRQALVFWPRHPEVESLLQQVETKEKETRQLAQELNDLVNSSRYYSARQVLFKLKQVDASHPLLSMEPKITAKIKAAESWVQKAEKAAKSDDALDCCSKALDECKDCKEAVERMAKYPPEPPTNLTFTPSPGFIKLQWNKSPTKRSILYRIIRKSQSQPLNARDGENLVEIPQTSFNDHKAAPGEIYYYGIYSKWGEIYSQSGAIAGPVIRPAEVDQPEEIPGDRVINLKWKAPARAKRIEVWLKEGGIPAKRGDGKSLQGVHQNGVVASGLKNGQLYGFLIAAVYQTGSGVDVYSTGLKCQSIPVEPPAPVTDLKIEKRENRLNISWTPSRIGTVQIFSSRSPFQVSNGEKISTAKLSSMGTQVPVQGSSNVQLPLNFQGAIYILPVTVRGDIGVVGKAATATSINEVDNLKGSINSGKLYLEWKWPTGAERVLILYNNDHFPTLEDKSPCIRKTYTREEYERNFGFIIRSLETKDYYFSVLVMAEEGKNVLYSTGQQCLVVNSGFKELYYDVHLNKTLFGKVRSVELRLFCKSKPFRIPKAVLVKKLIGLPLRKTDGMKILDIVETVVSPQPVSIAIPAKETRKGAYVKLFFEDDTHHQKFRIMTPSKDKLELG